MNRPQEEEAQTLGKITHAKVRKLRQILVGSRDQT